MGITSVIGIGSSSACAIAKSVRASMDHKDIFIDVNDDSQLNRFNKSAPNLTPLVLVPTNISIYSNLSLFHSLHEKDDILTYWPSKKADVNNIYM